MFATEFEKISLQTGADLHSKYIVPSDSEVDSEDERDTDFESDDGDDEYDFFSDPGGDDDNMEQEIGPLAAYGHGSHTISAADVDADDKWTKLGAHDYNEITGDIIGLNRKQINDLATQLLHIKKAEVKTVFNIIGNNGGQGYSKSKDGRVNFAPARFSTETQRKLHNYFKHSHKKNSAYNDNDNDDCEEDLNGGGGRKMATKKKVFVDTSWPTTSSSYIGEQRTTVTYASSRAQRRLQTSDPRPRKKAKETPRADQNESQQKTKYLQTIFVQKGDLHHLRAVVPHLTPGSVPRGTSEWVPESEVIARTDTNLLSAKHSMTRFTLNETDLNGQLASATSTIGGTSVAASSGAGASQAVEYPVWPYQQFPTFAHQNAQVNVPLNPLSPLGTAVAALSGHTQAAYATVPPPPAPAPAPPLAANSAFQTPFSASATSLTIEQQHVVNLTAAVAPPQSDVATATSTAYEVAPSLMAVATPHAVVAIYDGDVMLPPVAAPTYGTPLLGTASHDPVTPTIK